LYKKPIAVPKKPFTAKTADRHQTGMGGLNTNKSPAFTMAVLKKNKKEHRA
jgi:hypothetical protein